MKVEHMALAMMLIDGAGAIMPQYTVVCIIAVVVTFAVWVVSQSWGGK